MKVVDCLSIGVATFVLGGVVGAGIMKGVMTIQVKNWVEDFEKTFEEDLKKSLHSSTRRRSYDSRKPSDILFDTSTAAWNVVSALDDIITEYGEVSVADLKDLAGVEGSYTDNAIGWTCLDDVKEIPCSVGSYINFPEPIKLKGEK